MNSPRNTDQRTTSRLEGRPSRSEHTIHTLVDQASQIRDEFINSPRTEAQTRHLMHEHIRTITEIVNKLSRDILILESQIRDRDNVTLGTQNVVKSLEVHQAAGVNDLRARIVRCDASVARLSSDIKTTFDSIQTVSQRQHEQNTQISERLCHLDTRMSQLTVSIESLQSEHNAQLQRLETGTKHQLSGLDNRTRSLADDVKTTLQNAKLLEYSEREKLETRLMVQLDKTAHQINIQQEKMEQRHEKTLNEFKQKIVILQEELMKEKGKNKSLQQNMESHVMSSVDKSVRRTVDELARVKHEYRTAFETLKDSINEIKEITETKQKLTEEHFRKEIMQLRRELIDLRKIAVLI